MAKRKNRIRKSVSPDDNAFNRWLGYVPHLEAITDLELLTLKVHVVVEDALQHLLALRLREDEAKVKDLRLRFTTLVSLALAGGPADTLQSALVALDDARNTVAHRIGSSNFEAHLQRFTEQASRLSVASGGSGLTIKDVRETGDAVIVAVFDRASPLWKL